MRQFLFETIPLLRTKRFLSGKELGCQSHHRRTSEEKHTWSVLPTPSGKAQLLTADRKLCLRRRPFVRRAKRGPRGTRLAVHALARFGDLRTTVRRQKGSDCLKRHTPARLPRRCSQNTQTGRKSRAALLKTRFDPYHQEFAPALAEVVAIRRDVSSASPSAEIMTF